MVLTIRNLLAYLINIALGIITFFLGTRILLELFSANPATPFVAWVYSVSAGIISPFTEIFPNINLGRGSILDLVALISLLVYTVVAQLLIAVIDTLTRPVTTHDVTHEHTTHTHI